MQKSTARWQVLQFRGRASRGQEEQFSRRGPPHRLDRAGEAARPEDLRQRQGRRRRRRRLLPRGVGQEAGGSPVGLEHHCVLQVREELALGGVEEGVGGARGMRDCEGRPWLGWDGLLCC